MKLFERDLEHSFNALTIISSCKCNLSCSYCEINKNRKAIEFADKLQENTIKAFQDGSLLENVKKTYKYLKKDLTSIIYLDFWGQEPTLTLPYFTEHYAEWNQTLPNVKSMYFSTNGVKPDWDEIIFNYIITVDNVRTAPIDIGIQISYDGDWSCEYCRGFNAQILKDNVLKLFKKLNNVVLKHVKLRFDLHAVLAIDNIKRLNTQEKVYEYYSNLQETRNLLANACESPLYSISNSVALAFQQPYNANISDGFALANFANLTLRLLITNPEFKFIGYFFRHLLTLFLEGKEHDFMRQRLKYKSADTDTELFLLNQTLFNSDFHSGFKDVFLCGAFNSSLKMMYDGTLVGCQNEVFMTDPDYLIEEDKALRSMEQNLIDKHFYINLTTDPENYEEEIDKLFTLYGDGRAYGFLTCFTSTMNLMLILARCGQISDEYLYDRNKLIRHAIYLTAYNSCFWNNLNYSGSFFLKNAGYIRLFANGFLDVLDEWNKLSTITKNKQDKERMEHNDRRSEC